MPQAPSGTVTLLFTDIEGSTRMWEAHPDATRVALEHHDALVREAIESADGYVFKTVGDAFCAAFADAAAGLRAAVTAQRSIAAADWPDVTPIRARMALHSGVCEERGGDYFGRAVNRVARLEAIAHGGQIVASAAAVALLDGRVPVGVGLADRGEHRLKDLDEPEHVFEILIDDLAVEFPPLRSLGNPALRNNLPRFASNLVGRERELGELAALVDEHRLVTLTGSGGAGKTRLAVQAAADLLDGSGDGVWLVELGALTDPEIVPAAVAGVLGIREDATRPMGDVLVDALADRAVLIVLDNCEHLIDAAAKLADRLIRACPGVELIVTSREPLGIDGEYVYRVPSLPAPDAGAVLDDIAASDAVRLFVERGQAQQASFAVDASNAATLAAIVRRLDGIPLAIELAAARLRSMSATEINDRLDQRFRLLTTGGRTAVARQHTLRGAIDWSYNLLTEPERVALCRASAFSGGFDLAAAEAMLATDDTVAAFAAVDLVDQLVNKSLIQQDPTATSRYRLLESIREYAKEQLATTEGAVDELRRAHLAHYLQLAEAGGPQLSGPDQIAWNRRLRADHDNFIAALDTSIDFSENTGQGLRLAAALRHHWQRNGYIIEIIGRLQTLCDRDDPEAKRAAAFTTLAQLLRSLGETRATYECANRAVDLAVAHADARQIGEALRWRGIANALLGDLAAALDDAKRACSVADTTDDVSLRAAARASLGSIHKFCGELEASRQETQFAIDLDRKTGDFYGEALDLINLSDLELELGDRDGAEHCLRAAEDLLIDIDSPFLQQILHQNLGLLAIHAHDLVGARARFTDALLVSSRINDMQICGEALIGVARTLAETDPVGAATLQAAADKLLARHDLPVQANEARLSDETRAALQAALEPAELEVAYDRGRSLTIPELVKLVTQPPG